MCLSYQNLYLCVYPIPYNKNLAGQRHISYESKQGRGIPTTSSQQWLWRVALCSIKAASLGKHFLVFRGIVVPSPATEFCLECLTTKMAAPRPTETSGIIYPATQRYRSEGLELPPGDTEPLYSP